jgi:hypothetical protein
MGFLLPSSSRKWNALKNRATAMRGDVIYQVFGVHEGRETDIYFGSRRTGEEARQIIEQFMNRKDATEWLAKYHNKGFAIREKVVEVDFEIPSLPKPRDRYFALPIRKPNRPGTWDSTIVEIFRRGESGVNQRVADYERNYSLLRTFEPFRQGNREMALVSRDYTKTAVIDLASGQIIAEESGSRGSGFCPAGFFVPDWWDVQDGSVIPGSEFWSADSEWPTGDFGFVWGCVWGDDSSWKVEYLDLRRVLQGEITRDNRFGYVDLATEEYANPCLTSNAPPAPMSAPPSFIKVSKYNGVCNVTFAVEMEFALGSGKSTDWQRSSIRNSD